jgi:hypothetical protein
MRRALFLALLALAPAACTKSSHDPDVLVRAAIAHGAEAAEIRDLGELRTLVSGNYRDEQGHDRDRVLGLARAVLLAHDSVHVVTRVKAVDFPAPKRATATVVAGLAGRRTARDEIPAGLRVDLYRFELSFVEEAPGTWRVTGARWQPASLAEAL